MDYKLTVKLALLCVWKQEFISK